MSRSFKKNPFSAICHYKSNKKSKTLANKKFRKLSKLRLINGKYLPKYVREVSDVYLFDSDGLPFYKGKHYYDDLLRLGYSKEECDAFYSKIFRK